ncbi:reverse transcriptase domain-containing protein [Tanacetum coccineum]
MKELCQPSIDGRGGPIAPIPIQATDFGLRHHMIQQVRNTFQFHRLPRDNANRDIDKFLEITQHMKQNGVSDDALRLSLFPYSLTHHAIACHRDTINAAAGGTFMQKTPEECYELIENMTAHHNHWDTSATQDETSRNISSTTTTESPEVVRQLERRKRINQTQVAPSNELSNYKKINDANMKAMQNQINNVKNELRNEMQNSIQTSMSNQTNELKNMMASFFQMNTASSSSSGSLPRNTVANPRELVECLALADLDRSTTSPSGIVEDVFVKVRKFHFLAEFIVVDYVVDPRVPLILGKPFLRTARALIDVYGEELTLRVDDEAITFKYAQEVLKLLDSYTSGNPTPSLDPILSTSSPSLIPFKEGDFILEEIEACITNDLIPSGIDDDDFDPEGDLLLLENLLNDDPSSPLLKMQTNFLNLN